MSNHHCPCDEWVHPADLSIGAGLDWVPRQIAGFPKFRRAMLAELLNHPTLSAWRARGEDDLGVMLVEMWTYVCDVLAFYDEVLVQEAYLRTAQLRPSLRKLVDLLGYVPRPAVAASVLLAAIVKGRQPLTLPPGTAFRSQAFDEEPPQIFELDAETTIHPLNNQWRLASRRTATVSAGSSSVSELLVEPHSNQLKAGDVVLVEIDQGDTTQAGEVLAVATIVGQDGCTYDRVTFSDAVVIPGDTPPDRIRIWKSTQMASLWSLEGIAPDDPPPISFAASAAHANVVMDGLIRQIKPGQHVVLQKGNAFQWYDVRRVEEILMHVTEDRLVTMEDEGGESVSVPVPAVRAPASRLVLQATSNDPEQSMPASDWHEDDRFEIIVHYAFIEAGTATTEIRREVTSASPLQLAPTGRGSLELPPDRYLPQCMLVQDVNGIGRDIGGAVDPDGLTLDLDPDSRWDTPMVPPVKVFGNVLRASRGETVVGEVLGSGDASLAGQTFKLKKKPLTYVAAPTAGNERGVLSTLKIRVNGILWREAPTFFGAGPDDPMYVVRQTDDGETVITFGDGQRGRRLPTGRDNVVASYRFGAGAKAPPAGGITQLARPVKGLTSVHNPLPAAGGDDADGADGLRTHAPRSALILGRAVSIHDFQAVAASLPGVRAVRGEWRWDGARQGAVVRLWYVGEPGIEPTVSETLRNLADPTIAIRVTAADPHPLLLVLNIEIDPRHDDDQVLTAVRLELMDPETGLLAPERIGIGQPLFRSRIFERVLAVPGTLAVPDIQYDEAPFCRAVPFDTIAIQPGAGRYFDLEGGALVLNGREDLNG